jgi:hypothetical protein
MLKTLYPFLLLSGLGLLLSIVVHIAALTGVEILSNEYFFLLHGGIVVVWLPAVLVARRVTRQVPQAEFWNAALGGCPTWMRKAFYALFGYAILNFMLLLSRNIGQPKHTGTTLSDVWGFSGHWMVFYAGAFCILYSAIRAGHLLVELRCPRGTSYHR